MGKTLILLPFHLLFPQNCNRKMCWQSLASPWKMPAQLPDPTLQKSSGAAASFRQCRNHRPKSHFPSKKKGVETSPAGYSQWDGISAAGRRSQKNHVTPLPASPVGFSHIHLGNATPQRIPWDSWNPTGSGCFAGHAGTCHPAE